MVLGLVLALNASGDRGMIPVTHVDVSLYEPGQLAVLAWNGSAEILVLSTDVHASGDTLVLEILPLPSEPTRIELANKTIFSRVRQLIEDYYGQIAVQSTSLSRGAPVEYRPGVEVLFHERVGLHDITVVRANNMHDFVSWGEEFLRKNSINYLIKDSRLEEIVTDYIKDDVNYFVFDLLNVSTEERSVDPVLYGFDTDHLFYPMVISSIISGETKVTLFTFTNNGYGKKELPEGFDFSRVEYLDPQSKLMRSTPITFDVSWRTLKHVSMDSGMENLFSGNVTLIAVEYTGSISGLNEDFIISDAYWRKKAVDSYLTAGELYRAGNLENALEEAEEAVKLFDKIGDVSGSSKSMQLAEGIKKELVEGRGTSTTQTAILPPT
jgi:hypothetical protein